MTIGTKLTAGFGSMLALLLGLAWASLASISSLNRSLETAVNKTAAKQVLVGEIEMATEQLRTAQRGVILYSMLKNPAVTAKSKALFASAGQRVETVTAEVRPLLVTEEGRRAVDTIRAGFRDWKPMYESIVRMCDAGQFDDKLNSEVNKTLDNYEPMLQGSAKLHQLLKDIQAAEVSSAEAIGTRARWTAILLISLCLAVATVVIWTVRHATAGLREIAREMSDGAEQVASAASQIASSSQSLAQGAGEQAASIQETSASSTQINAMAQKNAENSRIAAQQMSEASDRVAGANRNLEQMVGSMNEIIASGDRISKIISVIDEIAFQTNILALNAAVEAARAGESGMGFAVVADEVRNLSQRCAQAAKDTGGLIAESIARSNDGKSRLDQVSGAIASITDAADRVKTLVEEVSAGSQEQSRGVEQVSRAVSQMEKVTQNAAATAEESASASEELSAQSAALNAIVKRLSGMVGGDGVENPAPVREWR